MALNEFELIQRYFSDIVSENSSVVQGVGDDCASINIPENCELLFSIDTQVADVHFPVDANPEWIAQRAFRCAISDLSAMGAEPLCFTLALTLPEANEQWLKSFSIGLKKSAAEFNCSLVGGDTTKGPLSITLQVHGTAPKGTALLRKGAQAGDSILVSGYLGGAAAYVEMMHSNKLNDKQYAHEQELFQQDYYFPTPCIALAKALRKIAHCAIDISDGLLADLQHLCMASQVNAELHLARLPLRPEMMALFEKEKYFELALNGGDDYQLCFTVSENQVRHLMKLSEAMEVPLTMIGKISDAPFDSEKPIACYDKIGRVIEISNFKISGYKHF